MSQRAILALVCLLGCAGCEESGEPEVEPAAEAEPAEAEDETEPEPESPEAEPVAAPEPETPWIGIDTHVDTTQRMLDASDDLATRLPDGHMDLPRMREGGLSGAFFSIWVNPTRYPGEAAWERASALIGAVRTLAERHPDQVALCTTAEEVRETHASGRIALLMGVEGGHALGAPDTDAGYLERLREFHRMGVRYMTVTWSNDNALGHSSGDDHAELGLTPLGRRAIAEMNRLGMIVDVSHVSDQTFWDILEVTRRPPLASHSSARALADHPRNMTDDMIRAVGERGGAVCVNYFTQFIDAGYRARRRRVEREHRDEFRAIRDAHDHSWQRWTPQNELARSLEPDLETPTVETLGAHFAHIVELGGSGAACLGSDFDGVNELPIGVEDAARLPALRAELERRELDARAIWGENVLRVLAAQTEPAAP